jgi:hypothetical protein
VKNIRFIFVHILLLGILFSVIKFLPISDKNVQDQDIELSKKNCENDDNNEKDINEDGGIISQVFFHFNNPSNTTPINDKNEEVYNSFFRKINIPPPKS